jgi:hypothetical protein
MTEIQLASCVGFVIGFLVGGAFVVWLVSRNVRDET